MSLGAANLRAMNVSVLEESLWYHGCGWKKREAINAWRDIPEPVDGHKGGFQVA